MKLSVLLVVLMAWSILAGMTIWKRLSRPRVYRLVPGKRPKQGGRYW